MSPDLSPILDFFAGWPDWAVDLGAFVSLGALFAFVVGIPVLSWARSLVALAGSR